MLPLILLHSAGLSHNDLKKLFSENENYAEILSMMYSGKRPHTPWMTHERYEKIRTKLHTLNPSSIERILDEKNIHVITIKDPIYPEKLRTIKQAPYLLYIRGTLREERKMIGIVGSRRNTSYGQKILETMIGDLVNAGCGIVSGGAYGIDALSHAITLNHSGYTISVFGCGVDIVYPMKNALLFEKILICDGALVSSFPISTPAEPWMFPVRNEIVAALSDGIVIPEAGIKSGTLITAKLALDHGRDVFAIPGDIFRETSQGTNSLIANGEAKCVMNSADILEEYFPNIITTPASLFEKKDWNSDKERDIYRAIEEGYSTPDSIGENTPYEIDTIIMTLTLLEMGGHIRLSPGGKYEII